MAAAELSRKELVRLVIRRSIPAVLIIPAIFFLSAWTVNYWQAWVFCAIIFIPMIFVFIYLVNNDPALLERRMRMREKIHEQRTIVRLSWIFVLGTFILPGFDVRFGWSHVPVAVIIAADVIVFAGYMLFIWVLRTNSYLSRIVEVTDEQKVVSSGPYVLVRHPMYLATVLMYIFTPLALGSFWAIIPAIGIIPVLVARILNEEKLLISNLNGYAEYRQKVKYRLFPGLW